MTIAPTSSQLPPDQYSGLLASMTQAAREAGALALAFFRDGGQTSADIQYKDGGSPVSEADILVNEMLLRRLAPLAPQAGWLSEETADNADRLDRSLVFIVDPIDGTRAFIKGDRRWGVSLALVESGRPILGVLHMPALDLTYAAADGCGATLNGSRISVSAHPRLQGARFAGPVKAMEGLERQGFVITREPRVPSLAYRLALIASGHLEAAVASTNAWDWDIAAAHLLIREAGGTLTDLERREPAYNGAVPRHGALTAAARHLHADLVEAIGKIAASA